MSQLTVTKFGHSCLLVEAGDARLLIDPGRFSSGYEDLTGLTGLLFTHQHGDHLDPEPVRGLLQANPDAAVVCDAGSAKILAELGSSPTVAGHGSTHDLGIEVTTYGDDHAVIHADIPMVENVGYLIAGRLFHPGDALTVPPVPVEVLALPAVAPWMAAKEAVDYLRAVAPAVAVPIHEAVASTPGMYYKYFENLRPEKTTVTIIDDAGAVRL